MCAKTCLTSDVDGCGAWLGQAARWWLAGPQTPCLGAGGRLEEAKDGCRIGDSLDFSLA